MKVLELKQRMKEKLEAFRADPMALPALVLARYANNLPGSSLRDGRKTPHYAGFRIPKKHKPHQIHTQHRASLVELLKYLVDRLDMRTMECKFVNPRFNITRPLYVSEMSRLTGLSERTIQRCIGTLVRAGYIARVASKRWLYLSRNLLRDLKLNVAFETLSRQLAGLTKRQQFPQGNPAPSGSTKPRQPLPKAPQTFHPSHTPYTPREHDKSDPEVGKEMLARIRQSRQSSDPPT